MKNHFWLTVFLLFIWCGFSNNFELPHVLLGLIISFMIVYFVMPQKVKFRVNIVQLIILVMYTIWELTLSSIAVAWDILTPKSRSEPKIIRLPLKCNEPVQISILSSLISLTPGTLVVDIEASDTVLVIHIMFAQNEKRIIAFIQNTLEPKVMKAIQNG